ncbi:hypothetical protein [Rubinisphaera margarita]|uniref:hypothetical protein n=1 Tax=Rubinisphaera margarita TaxID=2909586 RepID=UPI001EE8DF80|nr:hypothetical protein [Rubinisphaera margarita]MCG6154675.1 hypothetical protein [Rubinisphaera margarita]
MSADDAAKKKGKDKKNAKNVPQVLQLPDSIELTADQKKEVKEIQDKYTARATENREKTMELTPVEIRKQRAEATKAAKEEGKTQAEIRVILKDLDSSLSADTVAKLAELRKESQTIKTEFLAEVRSVLTDEQAEQLPKVREPKKNAKGKKKKAE